MKYPIVIETMPDNFNSVETVFDKYVNVFGVHIFGTLKTPTDKVLHSANIMAQYLDNNGDGVVDNSLVVNSMLNVPGRNNSKRILCLHGGGGNKNSLKTYQKGMIDLINHPDLKNSEFVFAESPLNKGVWYNDPVNKQTPTISKEHASESVKYLDDFINKNGPFDTILGYSQGVPMALIYLALGQKKNTDAKFYDNISYNDVLTKNLRVMDSTAISLAKESNIPILITNINKENSILDALNGIGKFSKIN